MRYFYHPESDSAWSQEDAESSPQEGSFEAALVEELTPDEYAKLLLRKHNESIQ